MRRVVLVVMLVVASLLVPIGVQPERADAQTPPKPLEAEVLADDPLFYWTFDEGAGNNALDLTGNLDGPITGATYSTETSVVGSSNSLEFDGNRDYIYLGSRPYLFHPSASWEFWVEIDEDSVPQRYGNNLMRSRWWGYEIDYRPATGILTFSASTACGGNFASIPISVDEGIWYHVVMTVDANETVVYMDGEAVATGLGGSLTPGCGNNLAIGRDGNNNSSFFNGRMDEWAMYDYALPEDRVVAHYCAGSGSTVPPCAPESLTVTGGDDQSVAEGARVLLAGTVDGAVPESVLWSVTDSTGSPVQLIGAETLNPSFLALDDGQYTVQLTATSGELSGSDEVVITVTNEDIAITASAAPTTNDGLVMVSVPLTDPGILDTHSATIDWGDGSTSTVDALVQGSGWATIADGHVYAAAGDYTIAITASDDDGSTTTVTTDVSVGGDGVPQPVAGAALWSLGDDKKDQLKLAGSGHIVIGTTHAEGELTVNGSGKEFYGPVEWVKSSKLQQNNVYDEGTAQVASSPPPVTFDLADYEPGGDGAVAAGAQYFDKTSSCSNGNNGSWNPTGPLEPGLYYVDCNVKVSGDGFAAGAVTIVATGDISMTGGSRDLAAPFIDGLLLFSNANGNKAVKIAGASSTFSGFVYAPNGTVDVKGSGHTFECGLLGFEIDIAGSGHLFDAGRCGLVDPGGSLSDGTDVSANPLLVPTLTTSGVVQPEVVLPGQPLDMTVTVTNDGATVAIPGLVALANGGLTSATVDSATYLFEAFDLASNDWVTIGTSSDGSAGLSASPVPSGGVAYGTPIVGTTIAVDSVAVWAIVGDLQLSTSDLAYLTDPAQVGAVRSQVVLTTDVPFGIRQTTRFGTDVVAALDVAATTVTAVDGTLAVSTGDSTTADLADLAPGDSDSFTLAITGPGGPSPSATERGVTETETEYFDRLNLLDQQPIIGLPSSSGTSTIGPVYDGGEALIATVGAPVLRLAMSRFQSVEQGGLATVPVTIVNDGSADATNVAFAVSEATGLVVDASAAPTTIAAGATVSFDMTVQLPADQVEALDVQGELTWADAAANQYGTLEGRTFVRIALPSDLIVTKSADLSLEPDGNPSFFIQIENPGDDPIQNVVLTDVIDPGHPIIPDTLIVTQGTASIAADGTLTVDIGELQRGSVFIDFEVDISVLPATATTIENQASVSGDGFGPVLSDDPGEPGPADPTVLEVRVGVGGFGEGDWPIAGLSPTEGSLVTTTTPISVGPVEPVGGATAVSWEAVAYPAGGDPSEGIPIGSGSGAPPSDLGDFDPSLVENGIWIIRLSVTDSTGDVGIGETSVIVDGQLKLGRFSLTYEDMNVGVGGIPIRMLRTYDTLDRTQSGDFGYGWNLEMVNIDIQASRQPLGLGPWVGESCGGGLIFTDICWSSDSGVGRYVTVTWPNGETETFDLRGKGNTFFASAVFFSYEPREGATSTLKPLTTDDSGGISEIDGHMHESGFGDGPIYNPTRWELTDRFGSVYILDAEDGLVEMTDRNGNNITVSDSGVVSSNGPSLTFVRDAEGRITSATGPDGQATTYTYDADGDLVGATDQNGNTYTYGYDTVAGAGSHYLSSIDDPGSGPAQVLTYGADGRLESVTDAEGNVTQIDVDIDARSEIVTSPDGLKTTITQFDERGNAIEINEVYGGVNHVSTFVYNADDLVETRTDANGNSWSGSYDEDENLLSFTNAEGEVTGFTYDQFGFPTSVTDAEGATTTFSYDGSGNLETIVDANSGTQTFGYDARGNQVSRTDQLNRTWLWTYDSADRVQTATDPRGNTTTYAYDGQGRVTSATAADGGVTSYSYDLVGNLVSMTDPLSRITTYGYDSRDRLTTITDPAGGITTYAYDDNDRVVSMTDPTSREWTYTYVFDRLATETAPDGGVTTYAYDEAGRVESITDPLGRVTTYGYDGAGRQVSTTRPVDDGGTATSTVTLDGNGRPIVRTNAESEATTMGYDDVGRLLTSTDPLGRVTSYGYDPVGNQTSFTNGAGESTVSVFDLANQLTSVTNAESETTGYAYDLAGNLASITDPLNRVTVYGYDDVNRQVSVTLPSGDSGSTVYNTAGEVTSSTSPGGVTQTFTYDPRGLLATVTDALGNIRTNGYDAAGRRVSVTDGRGFTTTFGHDPVGRLVSETDPLGGVVSFGYDLAGQRTSVTDANGATRLFDFDDGGRMVTAFDGLARPTAYSYDLVGRPTQMVDARGVVIDMVYDNAGQLLSESSPTETHSYSYDGAGRRTLTTDASGSTSFDFDDVGRLLLVAAPAGDVGYSYNGGGEMVSMSQPEGAVSYTYDANGYVASVTDWRSDTVAVVNDPDGRVVGLERPNDLDSVFGFDAAGRLESITHSNAAGAVEAFTYDLDGNGNRTGVTSSAGVESYVLDELNRVTSASYADGTSEAFGYDPQGYRISHTDRGGTATSFTVDAAGQLVSDSTGATYAYDNAGNLVSSSLGDAYVWDDFGRLVEADAGGVTETYQVDADGVRVSVDGVGQVWDRAGLPTLVSTGDGDSYVHGPTGVMRAGDDWLLTDAVGSVRVTADDAGAVSDTSGFTVFGEPIDPADVFGFAGEQTDATGLVHLRARQLDPALGRFLSVDPVQPGAPGTTGWGLYSYAGNNPTSWTDPTGQNAIIEYSTTGAIAGGVIGAAVSPFVCQKDETKGLFEPTPLDLDARCVAATIAGGAFFGAFGFATIGMSALSRCIYGGAIGAVDGYATTLLSGRGDAAVNAGAGAVLGCVFSLIGPAAGIVIQRIRNNIDLAPGGARWGERGAIGPGPSSRNADELLAVARQVKGEFPRTAGPNEVLFRTGSDGSITFYQVYDEFGRPVMRVDLVGPAHGPIPTPHVQEFTLNTNPATGETFVNKGPVRAARPEEIPS